MLAGRTLVVSSLAGRRNQRGKANGVIKTNDCEEPCARLPIAPPESYLGGQQDLRTICRETKVTARAWTCRRSPTMPLDGKYASLVGRAAKPPRPKQQPSFEVCKRNALSKLDKSPKGSLDEPVAELVHDINQHPDYVTTSSCSGRVSLFATFGEERNRGGRWLLCQHATVTVDEVTDALLAPPTPPTAPPPEMVLFKHEPGILHVQCRHLEAAKRLLQVALGAGFRESGLVLSGSEKVMLAIRTTSNSLELPLATRGAMLLPASYMALLVAQANERFAANRARTDGLHAAFLAACGGDADADAEAIARCGECTPPAPVASASKGAAATPPWAEEAEGEGEAEGGACRPS